MYTSMRRISLCKLNEHVLHVFLYYRRSQQQVIRLHPFSTSYTSEDSRSDNTLYICAYTQGAVSAIIFSNPQPSPRHVTHQCKQTAFPCCSLKHSLCTRIFHLGFVGNCESWDMQPYHQHQLDSLHLCCSWTPVGLVGCTTLAMWALVLCLAHSTLYHSPWRSVSRSVVGQTE